MKINLYLDGNPVEIDKDIDFVLNKQYTELSDLTSIIVDYSKTIRIPMTAGNNELFNHIYKLDHRVVVGQNVINYDPSRRIPMMMEFNGTLVMEGYAVLEKVDLKEQVYEINLYGQLGKIFSELKNMTLENYTKSDNGFWKSVRMNTQTIEMSFTNEPKFRDLDWDSYSWVNFFGFAPQAYGKTDLIDTKSCEVCDDSSIINFADVINENRNITYGDVYVGDGFDFTQYGEIRSYLTRPYVYADKIIQLVKNQIDTGDYDGYTLELSGEWFNASNPYYSNLCYFPGRESIVDNGESVSGLLSWSSSEMSIGFPRWYMPDVTSSDAESLSYTKAYNGLITITNPDGSVPDANISLNCDGIQVRDRVTGVDHYDNRDFINKGAWAFWNLSDSGVVPIRYIGVYDENDRLLYKLYLCDDTINTVKHSSGFLWSSHSVTKMPGMWEKIRKQDSRNIVPKSTTWGNNASSGNFCEVIQTYNFGSIVLNTNKFRFKQGCDNISLYGGSLVDEDIPLSEYHTLCPFENSKFKNGGKLWKSGSTWSSYFTPIQNLELTSLTYRSGSKWSIIEILGNDFNPFKWFIDYVKKFRLFFDIDYQNKKIILKSDYFNNVEYKDVIVDYSKGVSVEPLINKYQKVDYGYADDGSRKGDKYRKKYGTSYGDVTIDTGINITPDKLSLIPDKDEGVFIPVSSSVLNWENLSSRTDAVRYGSVIGTNKIINTLDKNDEIKYFPFYCFRVDNKKPVHLYTITDDTPDQKLTGKYCLLDRNVRGGVKSWDTEVEDIDDDGDEIYYMVKMVEIPQFDNYIEMEVTVDSVLNPTTRSMDYGISPYYMEMFPGDDELEDGGGGGSYRPPVVNPDISTPQDRDTQNNGTYIDPITGETVTVPVGHGSRRYVVSSDTERLLVPASGGTYTVSFWTTPSGGNISVSASCDFISLQTVSSETGRTVVRVTCSALGDGEEYRECTIKASVEETDSMLEIGVDQDISYTDDTDQIYLETNPDTIECTDEGGEFEIKAASYQGIPVMQVISGSSFVTVTVGRTEHNTTDGLYIQHYNVKVNRNSSGLQRKGTIQFEVSAYGTFKRVNVNVIQYASLPKQKFIYWTTFGVPQEVYNGNIPSNLVSYSIYNRWRNYLDEIFNINNKKVTCYVYISYPEFINFKFNQLFVIDNCTFLVNAIKDFNPNSSESTCVELIQISNPRNLR